MRPHIGFKLLGNRSSARNHTWKQKASARMSENVKLQIDVCGRDGLRILEHARFDRRNGASRMKDLMLGRGACSKPSAYEK